MVNCRQNFLQLQSSYIDPHPSLLHYSQQVEIASCFQNTRPIIRLVLYVLHTTIKFSYSSHTWLEVTWIYKRVGFCWERERESINEGRFVAASSYVNLEQVYGEGLWDKCFFITIKCLYFYKITHVNVFILIQWSSNRNYYVVFVLTELKKHLQQLCQNTSHALEQEWNNFTIDILEVWNHVSM